MNSEDLEKLKYPIGKFQFPIELTVEQRENWMNYILEFPNILEEIVNPLTTEQLNWHYRPEGWKIKQVIHHLADSHMNAYIRFKLTVTENNPVIRPYEEALWANLHDAQDDVISNSLQILKPLHNRWFIFMKSLNENDWNKSYFHPQHQKLFSLNEALGIYYWHSQHHLEHIKNGLLFQNAFK